MGYNEVGLYDDIVCNSKWINIRIEADLDTVVRVKIIKMIALEKLLRI